MKTNAKINLGLSIVERRPDGYHNIETVFYPIPLCDELIISEADDDKEDQLEISGIPVAGDLKDNLVMRVLANLREDYDIPFLNIDLQKNIPSGAGLGGGSSDAAFMMKMVNEKFNLMMTDEEMEHRVSSLGADCAFFIKNKPIVARGIGNEFCETPVSLKGWWLVLVKPNDFVSTREAYAQVTPQKPEISVEEIITKPVSIWKSLLKNDFEDSVFPQHPTIANIKHTLYQLGAEYAAMSGSGSSVFGLFASEPKDMAELFHPHFYFCGQLD